MNNYTKRKLYDKIFYLVALIAVIIALLFLAFLFYAIIKTGISKINFDFIFGRIRLNPSGIEQTGILPGLLGSIYSIIIVIVLTIPIGIGGAIYLEEYLDRKSKIYKFFDILISNLNGVPSVVYGLLGSMIFISGLRGSVLAAGVTLSLLILPVIIVASQEALKTVPSSLKESGYGLGFNKLQVIKGISFPYALPTMLTGIILAISRAIGEAAPLIVIGVAVSVTYNPVYITDKITTLPILINEFTASPSLAGIQIAAATAIVLLTILLLLNTVAVIIRLRFSKSK